MLRALTSLDIEDLRRAPARQAASFERTEHRPWPVPAERWVMGQTWDDLLFAHWRAEPETLRGRLPAGLELDTHEGEAWVGVTPFLLTGVRARGTPALPFVSSFREINVRTYVVAGGKPGIWFVSLDASSAAAVEIARRTYRLPYHRARITAEHRGGSVAYSCARADGARPHVFEARYQPAGEPREPHPGTLEHFLTERYCLYTEHGGRLHRAEIHHAPWPLQPADAGIDLNTMPPDWLELPDEEPLLHFSRRQDVVVWPLRPA